MSSPKDLRETVEQALTVGLAKPRTSIQNITDDLMLALKDRLAQEVMKSQLAGETPKELFDRIFKAASEDEPGGGLMW